MKAKEIEKMVESRTIHFGDWEKGKELEGFPGVEPFIVGFSDGDIPVIHECIKELNNQLLADGDITEEMYDSNIDILVKAIAGFVAGNTYMNYSPAKLTEDALYENREFCKFVDLNPEMKLIYANSYFNTNHRNILNYA